jgi:hypothetical protein
LRQLHLALGHVVGVDVVGGQIYLIKICYSIDAFPDVAPGERSFFQIHEQARTAAQGPRCTFTGDQDLPPLHKNDPIEAFYFAGNGGEIEIDHIAFKGKRIE